MMAMSSFLRLACFFPVTTYSLQAFKHEDLQEEAHHRHAVWIVSLMRSGSSTILSMMSSTVQGKEDVVEGAHKTKVFSSFEPCTSGDKFSGELKDMNKKKTSDEENSVMCSKLIDGMSNCNFGSVEGLKNWKNIHSTNGGAPYKRSLAEKLCKESEIVAVKTVMPMRLENVTWVLDRNPHLKIIEVIRDPRGMYASDASSGSDLEAICKHFSVNLGFKHPRVYRVIFEELVKDPLKVTKGVYKFLGRRWSSYQDDWVQETFNADCNNTETGKYKDCHSDSKAVATAWKAKLSSSQKKKFKQNEDCQNVAKAYKFHS